MAGEAKPRAITFATEHFKSKQLKKIVIPEWGKRDEEGDLIPGEEMVVFATPFTLRDQGKLQHLTETQSAADALAEVLILKLVDEDGDKVFTLEDKKTLREGVAADVVARVATAIMGSGEEALEKN